jgi:hypothetical protein
VSFLLQLSMITALMVSFKVVHVIAVMVVENYGVLAVSVMLAIVYGVTVIMETGE